MKSYPTPFNETLRQNAVEKLRWIEPGEDPVLEEVVATVTKIFDVPTALVSLVDQDRQWFPARAQFPAAETSRDYSICAHAILQHTPLILPDTLADPRFAEHPVVVNAPYVRFYAGAPIVLSSGLRVGSLCALDYVARAHPTPEQVELLTHLSRIVASTLERLASEQSQLPANGNQDSIRRNLLALIGHELRTPLTSVLGFSRILEARLTGPEKEMAKASTTAALHLSEIIDHLITYADLRTGEVLLSETNIEPNVLVSEISTVLEPLFSEVETDLSVSIDPALESLSVDPAHFKSALTCLLMNAAVHGGSEAALSIYVTDSQEVVFEVADNGNGFTASAAKCLQPFQVGADIDTRTSGGIGLGLPLAQQLVELHGGELSIVSMKDGVRAALKLPKSRATFIELPPLPASIAS